MKGWAKWVDEDELDKMKAEISRLKQENEALWQMVDDFNEAVKKAAGRLPA